MHLKVYRRSQNWHPKGRYYAMHLDTPDGELCEPACNFDPSLGVIGAQF